MSCTRVTHGLSGVFVDANGWTRRRFPVVRPDQESSGVPGGSSSPARRVDSTTALMRDWLVYS